MRTPPICIVLVTAFLAAASAYGNAEIEGGWQTKAGRAQERDTMTIRHLGDDMYEAVVRIVSCPSTECMNARIEEISLKSRLVSDSLEHKTKDCALRIQFAANQAVVRISGCKGDLPHGGPRGPF